MTTPTPAQYPLPKTYRFWLVQRLRSRTDAPSRKGFDKYFSMDYMGSTEFEIGEQFQSLKRMRSAGDVIVLPSDVTYGGVTNRVYFVGPRAGLGVKMSGFGDWMANGCRGQESSYFPERFTGSSNEWTFDVVAWWSLADDIGWALSEGIANDLRLGFLGDPA